MADTALVDSPAQVEAPVIVRGGEIVDAPAEKPTEEKLSPGPAMSLADSIRAKLKSGKSKDDAKEEVKAPAKEPLKKAVQEKPVQEKTPDKPEPKRKAKDARHDVDPIKLAEAQGREIGDRIASRLKPDEPAKPPVATDEEIARTLPEEYRADVAIYQEMKRLMPEKHGNILSNLKQAAEKETRYIEEWERQHPGEDFDPDDEAHNAFYKKNFPEIPERDFKTAERSLDRASTKAEVRAELDALYGPELARIKNEKAVEKIAPVIASAVQDIIAGSLGAIDEKLAMFASDKEKLNSLHETNPLAADVIGLVHQIYSPMIAANIAIHQGTEEFSTGNPAHVALLKLALKIEAKTSAAPVDQRIDSDGRMFATREKYKSMSPDEQARHWFVDQDVLNYILSQDAANSSRQWFSEGQEKYKKWAKANGIKLPENGTPAPSVTPKSPTEKAVEPEDNPPEKDELASPPAPGRGQLDSPWSDNESGPKTGRDLFLKRLRGG